MKQLNATFTEKEFAKIKKCKRAWAGNNWELFILHLVAVKEGREGQHGRTK